MRVNYITINGLVYPDLVPHVFSILNLTPLLPNNKEFILNLTPLLPNNEEFVQKKFMIGVNDSIKNDLFSSRRKTIVTGRSCLGSNFWLERLILQL
jgi:hypothetical protein